MMRQNTTNLKVEANNKYLGLQGNGSDVALADVPMPRLGFLQHCLLSLGHTQPRCQCLLERKLGVFVALEPGFGAAPQVGLAVLLRLL